MKSTDKIKAVETLGGIEQLLNAAYNILHVTNKNLPHDKVELSNIKNLIEGDFEYQQKIKRYCDVINAFTSGVEKKLLQK